MGKTLYNSLDYDTPQLLCGKHSGSSALIIGTGCSTSRLLPYAGQLHSKFDVVIGTNMSIIDFEQDMDYHIVMEKTPLKVADYMIDNGYRKDLPRILNYKAIKHFPQDIPIYKARRVVFSEKHCSWQQYQRETNYAGLAEFGKDADTTNRVLTSGTVLLNTIHFACILGCSSICMIGADLSFGDKYDHYYRDSYYREKRTPKSGRSALISVKHNDKNYETTAIFADSAKRISALNQENMGIKMYDFSDGLLTIKQLNIDEFMDEQLLV